MHANRRIDRRDGTREALFEARRRFPRLQLKCDAFYEGEEVSLFSPAVSLSLRGMFIPNLFPDRVGARGVVHVDVGASAMVRAEVEVVRLSQAGTAGMALRIVAMSESDRLRLAAHLLRVGGLAVIPQLDRRFRTLARTARSAPLQLAA